MGPFMQTKHLCVLIHYIINDEGYGKTRLSPQAIFLLTVQGGVSFVDLFVICYFCLSLPILDVCLLQPCGHLLGKS